MIDHGFKQKIALGAWAWGHGIAGGDQVFGNNLKAENLSPVFERSIELGLNLWDTAAVYGMGTSEEILGSFIKKHPQFDLVISTKFTPQIAEKSDHPVESMFNGSMRRLNLESADIYWIHNNDDVKKWTPEIIPLVKSGQVKHIGVSNHNLEEIKLANKILEKEGLKISAVQNHFSLLHRVSEYSGILQYCKENGIAFFSYMVLEQGALTGKYNPGFLFPEGSARAISYNKYLPKIEALTNVMNEVAIKHHISVAQVAISWAIHKGTLPIIGVTTTEQVDEAYKASNIFLSDEDIQKIESAAEALNISTIREWEATVL